MIENTFEIRLVKRNVDAVKSCDRLDTLATGLGEADKGSVHESGDTNQKESTFV